MPWTNTQQLIETAELWACTKKIWLNSSKSETVNFKVYCLGKIVKREWASGRSGSENIFNGESN